MQKPMLFDDVFEGSPIGDTPPFRPKCFNSAALLTPLAERTVPSFGFGEGSDETKLMDCGTVSPTCATKPDDPRLEFSDFRRQAALLAKEFYCAKDLQGMMSSIVALDSQCFHDELVAVLLRTAMDKQESDRTAVIKLLHLLSDEGHVSTGQLVRGYAKLVLLWEDLRLDVPDAPGQLVGFLSRKVGLLDKDLFKRLPTGLLQCVCDGFPAGASRDTMQDYVNDLVSFKTSLASLCMSFNSAAEIEALSDFLQDRLAKEKENFAHEVVYAACLGVINSPAELQADHHKKVFEMFNQFCGLNSSAGKSGYSLDEEPPLLTPTDMQFGFTLLLGQVPDLVKGGKTRPEVTKTMVSLLRCAVEQELLAADFLKVARRLRYGGPQGVQVVREAQRQTPAFSRRVWGSGDKRQLAAETVDSIREYFTSGNIDELGQIVGELHLSDRELIKFLRKLLENGLESENSEKALDAISDLMGFYWSEPDVQEAFDELQGIAEDLVLDLPKCREQTCSLMKTAHGRGLLEETYIHAACLSAV